MLTAGYGGSLPRGLALRARGTGLGGTRSETAELVANAGS